MSRATAAPTELERVTIEVRGVERTYWVSRANEPGMPVLVVLHGTGMTGPTVATWSGLAARGPEAGFATVFPDARQKLWDDHGTGRKDGADDAGFIAAMCERMVTGPGAALCLVGLSNGACFAERLARHGLVQTNAIVLVVGTAREASRRSAPSPARPTAVLAFEGTKDPMVPYGGGLSTGILGLLARRRVRRGLLDPSGHESVPPEVIVADWAAVNGCAGEPTVEQLPGVAGDPEVERLTWQGSPPVVLNKIIGGGHGWPGGVHNPPALLFGRVPKRLDATGMLLEFCRAQL